MKYHEHAIETTIGDGLPVTVRYCHTPGERAVISGPPEVCTPGSADETEINSVVLNVGRLLSKAAWDVSRTVKPVTTSLDILDCLNEATIAQLQIECAAHWAERWEDR